MQQQEFQNMIKKSEYSFFVFSSPIISPFNLALHTWIVIVYPDEKIIRRDFCHFKNTDNPSLIYLWKDWLQPREWIHKYFWWTKRFESKLLYHCSGKSDSLAYKVVSWIENNVEHYPYKHHYWLIWHNSNYFTQRILNQFPEVKCTLPRRAIWK